MTPDQRLQAELIRSVGRSTDTPASVAEACVALGRDPPWDLDRELFLRLTRVGEQSLKPQYKAAFFGLRKSAEKAAAATARGQKRADKEEQAAVKQEAKLSAATARDQKRADNEEQAAVKK